MCPLGMRQAVQNQPCSSMKMLLHHNTPKAKITEVESLLGDFHTAFEVKDKPIVDYHIRSSIEKTVKDHAVRNLVFCRRES